MQVELIALGLVAAAGAGLLGWLLARRYGRAGALVLPLLAVLSLFLVGWRARGLGLEEGIGAVAQSLVFTAPVLVGSLLGIVLAARRK